METKERINEIIKILQKKYNTEVKRGEPFKILISVVLSQRTRDETTNLASKRLFKIADTPEKILKLSDKEIEDLIYPVGFYKQKAWGIKKLSKELLDNYNGKVPDSLKELIKLHGVGDKTASCVLLFGFNKNTIPVDTHVNRISKRLEWVEETLTPEKVRIELEKILKGDKRDIVNQLFIQFGRDICKPISPKCKNCPIQEYCDYPEIISKNID
ncbi:MAG: endonuclease III [Candidatus Aenigmatarchaeota archaeon]|nr:MAG: endonuclease III [Candidatus Aenigmarchaeota archaeon]